MVCSLFSLSDSLTVVLSLSRATAVLGLAIKPMVNSLILRRSVVCSSPCSSEVDLSRYIKRSVGVAYGIDTSLMSVLLSRYFRPLMWSSSKCDMYTMSIVGFFGWGAVGGCFFSVSKGMPMNVGANLHLASNRFLYLVLGGVNGW